mgnify:CR=1 FL=1
MFELLSIAEGLPPREIVMSPSTTDITIGLSVLALNFVTERLLPSLVGWFIVWVPVSAQSIFARRKLPSSCASALVEKCVDRRNGTSHDNSENGKVDNCFYESKTFVSRFFHITCSEHHGTMVLVL